MQQRIHYVRSSDDINLPGPRAGAPDPTFWPLNAIGFVSTVGAPKHIDNGAGGSFVSSLLVDLGLLGVFAVQHSGMARPGFEEPGAGEPQAGRA